MKMFLLGQTGAEVSCLGLGTMIFGTSLDERSVSEQLNCFVDHGGTLIDTADMYAYWLNRAPGQEGRGGAAERVIGKWLKRSGKREQVFISSKVGNPCSTVEEEQGQGGLNASRILSHCEESLQRLGIDAIDLYYAHVDDRNTPLEETLEAFDRLVRQGKVRFIGASNWMSWRLEEARQIARQNGWTQFCCVQQKHSYLRPKAAQNLGGFQLVTEELADFAKTHQLCLVGHEPILKATYLHPEEPLFDGRFDYETAENRCRLKVLYQVAAELEATPIQIVLAWMVQCKPPVIPLVAADNLEQLEEDLQAADLQLSEKQIERLSLATA